MPWGRNGFEFGARKRLMVAQAHIHKKDWERGSLPQLQLDSKKKGLMINTVDATTMMANISQHAKYFIIFI